MHDAVAGTKLMREHIFDKGPQRILRYSSRTPTFLESRSVSGTTPTKWRRVSGFRIVQSRAKALRWSLVYCLSDCLGITPLDPNLSKVLAKSALMQSRSWVLLCISGLKRIQSAELWVLLVKLVAPCGVCVICNLYFLMGPLSKRSELPFSEKNEL